MSSAVPAQERLPVVRCAPADWTATLRRTYDEGFTFFDFLTVVDQTDAEQDPGFEVLVHLYDRAPSALRETIVQTRIADGARLPSCTAIWPGAAWHEREAFEMFGIGFTDFTEYGRPARLRGLLLPDGFDGHPLRKSFVLVARVSKPWPGAKEPGGGTAPKPGRAPRRRIQPPGIPDESWGPR